MSSNYDKIAARYSQSNGEDRRETESRHNALEFYYTKKHLDGYITKEKRVLELGCGTGYYCYRRDMQMTEIEIRFPIVIHCPWCQTGELFADKPADINISCHCSKCKKYYRIEFNSLRVYKAKASPKISSPNKQHSQATEYYRA